jgi:hypothetical protein
MHILLDYPIGRQRQYPHASGTKAESRSLVATQPNGTLGAAKMVLTREACSGYFPSSAAEEIDRER